MSEAPAEPRRRFLRFSLRAMLLFVVVAATPLGWLAWQWRVVREREEMLPWILSNGIYCDDARFFCCERSGSGSPELQPALRDVGKAWTQRGEARVPFLRKFIGDAPIQFILLESKVTAAELQRVERTFPEALVWQCRPLENP